MMASSLMLARSVLDLQLSLALSRSSNNKKVKESLLFLVSVSGRFNYQKSESIYHQVYRPEFLSRELNWGFGVLGFVLNGCVIVCLI